MFTRFRVDTFEQLVDILQPVRDHTPLFQVMFILQNAHDRVFNLREMRAGPMEVPTTAAKFELTLSMTETDAKIQARFEYAKTIFDRDTIQRMITHLTRLLTCFAATTQTDVTNHNYPN